MRLFNNYLVTTIQIVLNVVLINSMIVLALLGIHEIAHVVVGVQTGCEGGRAVIFDTSKEGPYAELFCSSQTNHFLAHMAGLFVSVAFGSMFLLLRSQAEKTLFFIILGFSLIFSSLDIVATSNVELLLYASSIAGFVLVAFGEWTLTCEYIKRDSLFKNYLLANR